MIEIHVNGITVRFTRKGEFWFGKSGRFTDADMRRFESYACRHGGYVVEKD